MSPQTASRCRASARRGHRSLECNSRRTRLFSHQLEAAGLDRSLGLVHLLTDGGRNAILEGGVDRQVDVPAFEILAVDAALEGPRFDVLCDRHKGLRNID